MKTDAKDNMKVERRIFIVCFLVTLAVGLFTLFFVVSMKAFWFVVVVDAFLFILWYVNNDSF